MERYEVLLLNNKCFSKMGNKNSMPPLPQQTAVLTVQEKLKCALSIVPAKPSILYFIL